MSMVTHRSVWGEVVNVLLYTIELTLAALVIGVAIGLPLGIGAARHRNRALAYAARILSLLGLSFPAFDSAIMLLLAFAIQLHWFPVISEARTGDPLSRVSALVLPAVNLGLVIVAYVTRVARSSMLGVHGVQGVLGVLGVHAVLGVLGGRGVPGVRSVRAAGSEGVPARVVIWRHALGNALISVVIVVGLYLGVLIGNSVLTERQRGAPTILRSDNGPEFVFRAILIWMTDAATQTASIDPGKPWQNGTDESFNASCATNA